MEIRERPLSVGVCARWALPLVPLLGCGGVARLGVGPTLDSRGAVRLEVQVAIGARVAPVYLAGKGGFGSLGSTRGTDTLLGAEVGALGAIPLGTGRAALGYVQRAQPGSQTLRGAGLALGVSQKVGQYASARPADCLSFCADPFGLAAPRIFDVNLGGGAEPRLLWGGGERRSELFLPLSVELIER